MKKDRNKSVHEHRKDEKKEISKKEMEKFPVCASPPHFRVHPNGEDARPEEWRQHAFTKLD